MVPHPVQGQAVWPSTSEEHLDSWWRCKGTKGGSRHHASGYGHDAATHDDVAAPDDAITLRYGQSRHDDAARYDAATRHDAAARYDAARNDAATRHDAVTRNDAVTRHDATRYANVTARHDATTQYDAATRHDATAQYDAATRHDAVTRHGPSADATTRNDAAPTNVRPDAPSSSGLDATPAIRPAAIWSIGLQMNIQLFRPKSIDWLT